MTARSEAASADSVPVPLERRLPRVRERIEGGSRLLLCLDFDGTLAPIVDEPDEAAPTEDNRAAVAALSDHPAIDTAIVSGRALADVRERIDGPSIYAGNHGLELARKGSVAVHPVARKRTRLIEAVCETLETALDTVPNARIENKGVTATVHVRSVPSAARPVVAERTRAVVDRLAGDDLEISTGKRILEIEPAVPWGKGNAVALIAADAPADAVPIYVGDDVTDESAFRTVLPEGIAVRVGDSAPSAASCRVEDPDDVTTFLQWLGTAGIDLLDPPDTSWIDEPAFPDDDRPHVS
ncbi:trehalose 6-phosphate phosphatase [Halobiforma haloterrestris]|uniref:Trehalose 6-phosphate phosphatase n=1 Tax=Natronobacterium haloterrestre TaxID=148448 RepID=A0A1I1F4G6_NATHA|nr:trehalose-phosphatase [Halobiforma haloterrestris]SFB94359.1 trehalose 6-phosphate phosphatase [Halobiforma haloterrestris]